MFWFPLTTFQLFNLLLTFCYQCVFERGVHIKGNSWFWSVRLNNLAIGCLIEGMIFLRILGEIPSGPGGLVIFRFDNWSTTSWTVMLILSMLWGGPGPWGGSLGSLVVSICDILAKCLLSSDALSTGCIYILTFDFIGGGTIFLLLHFDNDLTIRHHLPGGIDLSSICDVSL